MSDPLNEIIPGDWLDNFVNDGIYVPWHGWQSIIQSELNQPEDVHPGIWKQFDDHKGGWFDTDLSVDDPAEKAFALTEKLAGCTAEQLDVVAELLYLAIKTTRTICGDLEQD